MSAKISRNESSMSPRSLYILVIFQVLQSLMLIGTGIYRLLENPWLLSVIPLSMNEIAKDAPAVLVNEISFIFVGTILLVLALFMLSRRYTAWLLSILVQGGLLLYSLIAYYQGNPRYDVMVSGVILVFYLNQSTIQTAFRSNAENVL